jgi:hypothetical protein
MLRLFPRGWRDRYGDEFIATIGEERLSIQQRVDIISAAIDAWLSAEVRSATRVTGGSQGGGTMTLRAKLCSGAGARYTTRDSLIGAGVIIGSTATIAALGLALRQSGWALASEVVSNVAFPGSMTISLPFWLIKGQPWKAQVAIVGVTLMLLVALAWMSVGLSS